MALGAEYEDSENKTSLAEWQDAVICLAAFATSRGGVVHFGISPEGKPVGVCLGKNTLENLANDIKRHTDPPVFPSIQVEGEERSAVVHVSVEESPIKLVWAFGKPYKRVGRTNQAISREETLRLTEATTGRTWDALPCPGLREADLSREAIEDFLRRSGQDLSTSTDVVLKTLRLVLSDGALCNAAALLFAEDPRRHVLGAFTQCGRFRGDTTVDFIDQASTGEPLIQQYEAALAFVAKNTRQALKITGRPQHEVVPEYPDEALREALINAICHRNYAEAGNVQVRIFHSGLEIWNPGKLPHDLSVEALYTTHPSRPRNRLIADAFHRAGLIEHWGTGTVRILRACEDRGMARPEFRAEMGVFVVRFVSSVEQEAKDSATPSLTDRQKKVLEYVRDHGSITVSKFQEIFGLKERQAQKDLRAMVRANLLKKQGAGPSTHYVVRD